MNYFIFYQKYFQKLWKKDIYSSEYLLLLLLSLNFQFFWHIDFLELLLLDIK